MVTSLLSAAVGAVAPSSAWGALGYGACGLLLLKVALSFGALLPLVLRWWRSVEDRLHLHQRYRIPRYSESLQENPLYRKAAAYISSLPSLEDSDYANIFSSGTGGSRKGAVGGDHLSLQLDAGHTVHDSFLGARISWTNVSNAALVLSVRRQDKRRVLRPYLDHVESVAEEIELRRREVRLYTNSAAAAARDDAGGDGVVGRKWRSVPFAHPSTLDTVAMDPELKNRIRADLENFLKNKAYYHRLGRVWKRSYLLYGPPGTGKSSFVAAMAKFLCYDIYDLDLARIADGSDLKALLLQTTPRSVIVVEDLDRYLHTAAAATSPEVNLSGILNFMDGIFSCCGEERVMVFTMNGSKEEVDPAVLRPGRLDVHIHFPLCDFPAFKTLASSYLGLKDHKLYPQVEEIFQSGTRLSQAEIGEIMIANRGSPSRALKSVISALQQQHRKEEEEQQQQQQGSAAGRMGAALLGRIGGAGGGIGRRRIGEGRGATSEEEAAGQVFDGSGPLGAAAREGTLKEIRKLYGLLKLRSGSKREGSGTPSLEMAAAAAAAAAAGEKES
ncbi:hypothetical protein Taro_046073 [Colocasia esculenta]|uniref:AAA+ ATPase domain-containing protein n=1 Tax=Colocasia esculenta TaxID=4460 RepID=A0A843WSU8_COLES|nr:hypothetical protein [Colocasia esculenta]